MISDPLAPVGFIHHGALGDQLLSIPVLRRLSERGAVFFWSNHSTLISKFCSAHCFSLESFEHSAPRDAIEQWFSVGPCEYLNLQGNTTLLSTKNPCTNYKWKDWCLEAKVEPLEPEVFSDPTPIQSVIIAPGSSSAAKNWPQENFKLILLALAEKKIPFKILFGPVEVETGLLKKWQTQCPQFSNFFEIQASLELLAKQFGPDVFFIGSDSGPGHLAALMGCRGISIFQNSDPKIWSTWSTRFTSLGDIGKPPSPDEVIGHLPP